MSMKHCPQCYSDVSEHAKRCPFCQSDIELKTPGGRLRASLGKAAVIFRDWLGVPAAIAAFVTAYYDPAVGTL